MRSSCFAGQTKLGMETVGGSPEQLGAKGKSEMTRMEKVIQAAGIKAR